MSYINEQAMRDEYYPYNTLVAFDAGFNDYMRGMPMPRGFRGGVDGQAYDRGAECAMRIDRAIQWIEANVGAD